MSEKTKALLLKISASTADRLLKPYRDKMKLKKRYRGNPFSSNLKKSVKVESWFDRPKEPGYLEIDLVHHSGASGKGEFIYTLTATEVSTGWTELRPIRNKAMVWTKQALEDILKAMPMPIRKIHSDNGSEFINAHVQRFCKEKGIEFTRSRPYRKNDSPYVESKNWSMVRAYTGWRRYDTEEELEILKKLERLIAVRQNIFMPQMKLTYRHREDGKVVKAYEMDIPLRRVLSLEGVQAERKDKLTRLRSSIDIVRLSEE
ncbi:MAG: transposase family protein, partial [Thermodesulfovibrionales bacterium]